MSPVEAVREFVTRRLSAAAGEIFSVLLPTLVQYQEKIQTQQRLLQISCRETTKSQRTDETQQHFCIWEHFWNNQQHNIWGKEEPENLQLKVEQDGPESPQIKEELLGVDQCAETIMMTVVEQSEPRENLGAHNSAREFINHQLTAAAGEIYTEFQQTIIQCQEEIQTQQRLLEINLIPQIKLHRIDRINIDLLHREPEAHQNKEEQEETESPQIKEEDTESYNSHVEEQLVLKQEEDFFTVDVALESGTPLANISETHLDNTSGPQDLKQSQMDFKGKKVLPKLEPTESIIIKDVRTLKDEKPYDSSVSEGEDDDVPEANSDSPRSDSSKPTITEKPCSIQDTNDIIVASSRNHTGKRAYNKRHYCVYCNKPYAKIARHLQSAHKEKKDVAKAFSFPKASKERKKLLHYIRNRGNYTHNVTIMESGKGQLVPSKRPLKEAQGRGFLHCLYCQGLYTRKTLWLHIKKCKFKPGSFKQKLGKNHVLGLCMYTEPVPSHISSQVLKAVSTMNDDHVTEIIENDPVILEFGQHMLNTRQRTVTAYHNTREKMRELGRLLENARKHTRLKKMEDLINPRNYLEMVKAVKMTCGYESSTNTFAIPSLAIKLGNSLVKVCNILRAQGFVSNNHKLVRHASEFEEIHRQKWNAIFSAAGIKNLVEVKWNVPTLIPFTEDVQKLHLFLSKMQDKYSIALSDRPSMKSWTNLAKVCLTQTALFNRRREGEVANMPLSAFLSRDNSDHHEDLDWALSEVEKKLCRDFSRVVIKGKQGNPVPILLTPKMLCTLELLVQQREACGVLQENEYMFARPRSMTHFRSADGIRAFATACGAKCPKALTSNKLQKYAANLSTVLNMTNTQIDQMAHFLSHDNGIHGDFYQLSEKPLQLAKMSKVLMALEQRKLFEFQGKNLDEITIDPNENVMGYDGAGGRANGDPSSTVHAEESDEFQPTHRNRKRRLSEEDVSSSDNAARRSSKDKETVADSLGEKVLKKHKNCKQPPAENGASSSPSDRRHLSKGEVRQKRRFWQPEEKKAVQRQMGGFIKSLRVPSKRDCVRCAQAESEALKNCNWQRIKFYVYNQIVASKKKMQQ